MFWIHEFTAACGACKLKGCDFRVWLKIFHNPGGGFSGCKHEGKVRIPLPYLILRKDASFSGVEPRLRMAQAPIWVPQMVVSWNRATPSSGWYFPWNKPSSYGGSPIYGNPQMAQDLLQQLAEPLPQGPWSFRAGEAGRLPAPVMGSLTIVNHC